MISCSHWGLVEDTNIEIVTMPHPAGGIIQFWKPKEDSEASPYLSRRDYSIKSLRITRRKRIKAGVA